MEAMSKQKFTCEKCKETFYKGRSDAEAMKEYQKAHWNIPNDDIGIICADCFNVFKVWYNGLSEDDHRKFRGCKDE